MADLLSPEEEKNRQRGRIISAVIHTLILAVFLLPLLTFPTPPPGQEGILVNLGADFGQGDENAPEPIAEESQPEETVVEEQQEEVPQEEAPKVEETPEREVIETEDPEAIALQKKKEKEAADKAKKEQEERERKLEEQRQREEAERKKQEDAEKFQEAKDKFSGAFGGGSGSGKGNTGQQGNQGDDKGDPNASNLEGVSVGTGNVGGGLKDRGVQSRPNVSNPTNTTGTVNIEVCVDSKGNVISADYTIRNSTTSNAQLKKIAIDAAKKWKFSSSSVSEQCGTIAYTFKNQ
ncbi:MAG: energy transducer TonB [Phaeodactylibacter sp.]|nr:energy transducer TonB [Phaeodactylibacter sp.]